MPEVTSSHDSYAITNQTISSFLSTYTLPLFLAVWSSMMVILFTLIVSYVLLLFILVFFYSRNDEVLLQRGVRVKLTLYLLTPYFILFPLLSLVIDGLGQVSGIALVVSSILLIRISSYRRKQKQPLDM